MSSAYTARTAPLGIKVICVLGAIGGVINLLGNLPALASPAFPFALIALLIVIGKLAVLYGLWNLESWAWTWALIIYGLAAVASLFGLNIIGLLINVVVFVYILSKAEYYR